MRAKATAPDPEIEDLRRENAALRAEIARLRAGRATADREHRAELLRVGVELGAARDALEGAEGPEDVVLESATGFAILTMDPDGCVTAWNEGARRLFGWDEAEALGRDARMIFTPEDRAARAPEAEMAGAFERGQAEDERWHIRRDGSRFWASGLMMPLKGPDGEICGYLKILRDATRAERASRAGRESEARFRNMADHAPVMMWVTDPDGSCTYLNRRWYEFTGQTEAQAEGYGWLDATHPDDKERAGEIFRAANAAREPFQFEYRLRRADGTYRWAIDAASPRFDEDGTFLGYVGSVIDIDERREAEEALRESEERFRTALQIETVGAIYFDRGGVLTNANDAFLRMSGHSREDLAAGRLTWQKLTPPEWLADSERAFAELLERGSTTPYEKEYLRPDGTRWWALFAAKLMPDGTGFEFVLDITDRKQAEARLREGEERLRLATDYAEVGFWDVDLVNDVLVWPPRVKAMFGISPDAPVSMRDFYEGLHPDDRERTAQAFAAAVDPGRRALYDVEYRTVGKEDGLVRWVAAKGRGIFEDDGRCVRVVGTAIEVSARKRAEERLRDLNETLESRVAQAVAERDRIWTVSHDMFAVAGFDGSLKAVNAAWTRILGYDEATLLSMPFTDLIHPDDLPRAAEVVASLKRGQGTEQFEDRLRTRDGSYRVISWTAVPEKDVFYAIGRDVTELRQTEEALRQSQKMEAVGQLTGGIAHDFNNLLAGIVGALDLMQTRIRQGRTGEVERYVTAAISSAQRAAALTHRLLAFSRRQPLDPKPVETNALVAGMEDLLRRTIGPSVHLEMVLAGGLWRTLCDPVQLESTLLNLCINARDAMPEGGKLVIETSNARLDDAYAAASRDVAPGQYVCICVTDSGVGMPPDVIARAFDPFFTTKPIGQGTGLGLSMVYGFAKQSEGHVRIYSEPGQGTTVKVYLPRYRGAAEEEEGTAAPLLDTSRAEAGETVLVVEDEPVIRDLVVEVLQDLGYRALEASDGPSGLKVLNQRQRIDLLVTDVGLPGGMNGRQLADQARVRRPDLRVLFITGFAENATLANGFLEPGMQMVTKPFAIDALAAKIRRMIEGDRG